MKDAGRSVASGYQERISRSQASRITRRSEAGLAIALRHWLDQTGQGLLLVTHRPALLALCDRTIALD